ncbi:alpha-amylase family glycosyl hydrolase [Actinoplanes sp. NPDC049548]|uniref:alpha-amylase family glycosyl hydrolase n=1 Tax=Actinoplanes sp. NPDC049548 TaxID=3155152 RepID=UPI00341BEC5B
MRRDWLADAVMYEIYPQSFADSNSDGVGDLRGVIDHLDHIASLGVDVIWFNPCFASPFVDAGYDVADYLTVAPRYGTNEDMAELVAKARERGIRVLLDLVAGHTSIEHPWFRAELAAGKAGPDGDRYIWCEELPARTWAGDIPGTPAWVRSPGPRKGYYLKNFYDEQPALNFGWVSRPGGEPWRDAVDAPGPRRNRRALRDIIAFWLDKGVAGFRVDMAFSLVKDESTAEGLRATVALWREIREWLDEAYPDAVLIPEGVEPRTGGPLAFDADFFLVIHAEHASLFDNHGAGLLPFQAPTEPYFGAGGRGSTRRFLDGWAAAREADPSRLVVMATADHDFSRLCCGPRTAEQLGAALTFLFTWGTVPCLYYGDEIGMRYLPGLPDVEGSVCNPSYNRAGCRTPMQWDDGPNAGFSTADPVGLYLPVDPDPQRPTVAAQERDPASTLAFVRELVALRRATPALGTRAPVRVVSEGYPFAYVRGESHLVVVNPRREAAVLAVPEALAASPVLASGVVQAVDGLRVDGFGYGILGLGGQSCGGKGSSGRSGADSFRVP